RSRSRDRKRAPPRLVTLTGDADPVDSTNHDRLPGTEKYDSPASEWVIDSSGGFDGPFTQGRAQRWRHVELERRHSQGGFVSPGRHESNREEHGSRRDETAPVHVVPPFAGRSARKTEENSLHLA